MTLEERRIEHINKYMIHCEEIKFMDIESVFPISQYWCYDTESCRDENDIESERVYAWILTNTDNDYAIWGETLEEFFNTLNYVLDKNLAHRRIKNEKKLERLHTVEIFCHNLGWDIEFSKYYLHNKGYEYYRDEVENKKLIRGKQPVNTFTVVENRNNVYASTIVCEGVKCANTFKFYDSFKIMSKSLDTIGKDILKVDEMFYKMKDDYDYESIRPHGHRLTLLEKQYVYNDGYLLKEFIKQFYIPLGTTQKTASGIAFEFFLETRYHQGTISKNYVKYEEEYPQIYNPRIRNIIDESYNGGLTQANRRYIGNTQILKNLGCSVDINSSYPSRVRDCPLPYGQPKLIYGDPQYDDKYTHAILTIEFDGFRNKQIDDVIGKIKVGAKNTHLFGLSGNEYAHTNFIKGKLVGGNGKSENHLYRISIWDFELDCLLKNMNLYIQDTKYDEFIGEEIRIGKPKKGYKIISSLMFKMNTGAFAKAVDICMKMKNEGKAEGNKCKQEDGKLKANSFYGKTGATDEREMRYLVEDEHGLLSYESDGVEYLSEKKYYKAFASCVTAHARVNLLTVLYQLGYNNVIYWDTDSLYTTLSANEIISKLGIYAEYDKKGNITKVINPNGKLDKFKLGCWDIEKEYDSIKAIGAKKYIVHCRDYGSNNKMKVLCKCAGLPADVRKNVTFDEFYLGQTFKGKKAKKKVKGGYRLVEGDFKLNNTLY